MTFKLNMKSEYKVKASADWTFNVFRVCIQYILLMSFVFICFDCCLVATAAAAQSSAPPLLVSFNEGNTVHYCQHEQILFICSIFNHHPLYFLFEHNIILQHICRDHMSTNVSTDDDRVGIPWSLSEGYIVMFGV